MIDRIKKKAAQRGFQKYFKNTSWLLVDRMLRLFLGLLVGVYVARYLGPNNYGLLQYSISYVAIIGPISKMGLGNIVVREIVLDKKVRHEVLGTSFTLRIIGSFILLIFVFILISITENDYLTKTMIIIIALGQIFHSVEIFEFFFRANVKAKYASIARIAGLIYSSISRLLLIYLSAPLLYFAIVYSTEWLVKGIFLIVFYHRKKENTKRWSFNFHRAKYLLKNSWPFVFSGISIMIFLKIDQIMVKNILGNRASGLYAVVIRLSELWFFIPMAINNSLMPAIMNYKKKDNEIYLKRLTQLFSLISKTGILIAITIFIFSKHIINILYGVEYLEAYVVLRLYIWSSVFMFLNNTAWQWHIAENNQKLGFYRSFIAAILNIVLNWIFIPIMGLTGAAFASLVSYCFVGYLGHLIFPESRILFKIINRSLLTFKF